MGLYTKNVSLSCADYRCQNVLHAVAIACMILNMA